MLKTANYSPRQINLILWKSLGCEPVDVVRLYGLAESLELKFSDNLGINAAVQGRVCALTD